MSNSIIYKSRQGYAYQDKYALLKFLEYFQTGRLIEFYIDYPFSKNNSLDILAIFANPNEENIFEIKTGDSFKSSKNKHLKKELEILYNYNKKDLSVSKIVLAIDPTWYPNHLKNWSDLEIIKKNTKGKFGNEKYTTLLKRVYEILGVNMGNILEFKEFIRKVEFDIGNSNKKIINEERTDLEKMIVGHLNSIGTNLKMNVFESEYSSWIITQELLEIIKQNAGNEINLLDEFKGVLIKALCRRKIFYLHLNKPNGMSVPRLIDDEYTKTLIIADEKYQKYSSKQRKYSTELNKINNVIENSNYRNKEKVKEWLDDSRLNYYFLNKLPKNHFDLNQIDFILDQLVKNKNFYNGPYVVFDILKESVSEKNNSFIINFLANNYKYFEKKKRLNENSMDLVITILNKIIKEDSRKVDEILEILKKITKKEAKNLRDLRTGRDYEKQLIAELVGYVSKIYIENENIKKTEELVGLIKENFNLVDDDSRMEMYTPNMIFEVLRKYIDLDFENNFPKVKEITIEQYQNIWKKDFKGWEFSGGGISQSGSHFSVSDRHFNEYTFIPAIDSYYEKSENRDEAWNFIKALCYATEKEVSVKKPDFLSRAIINLLFRRYKECDGENKKEAFNIIKEFVEMREGIPHKTDLIYQYILNNEKDLSFDEKWGFVKISLNASWNKKNVAVNIFIERIIGELVEKKHQLASEWMKNNIQRVEAVSGGYRRENGVVETIGSLLRSEDQEIKEKGVEMFHEFIKTERFYEKFERFDVFNVANLFATVFDFKFEKGLSILNEVYAGDNLTINQQILITSGINRINETKNKKRIFDKFLAIIFKDFGEVGDINDIKDDIAEKISNAIVSKFDHDYARVAIVELGELLAKEKYFKEAMIIARIFINDPDPRIDDQEFNYHEKIKEGKEGGNTISISTVRGWVCWLLSHVPVLDGQDYIEEVTGMVKNLTNDENYYIRYMATFPLMQLVQIRHTVIEAETTNRFIPKELASDIENIAFNMLRIKENRKLKAVMFGMVRVFNYIRSLDAKTTIEVLNYFEDIEDEETLRSVVSLFIFFAEFRKDSFIGGIWEDDYFKHLKDFNDGQIRTLLEEVLKNGNKKIKASFAWKFSVLIEETKTEEDKDEYFNISLKYLKILSNHYSPEVYDDIHSFINAHISKYYNECIDLFKTAIEKEKTAIGDISIEHEYRNSFQRSYYYFEQTFDEIFKRNKNDFLNNFELIMRLPSDNFLSNCLMGIARHLLEFKNEKERIDKIFDYLIENVSPNFYDLKMEWERKN